MTFPRRMAAITGVYTTVQGKKLGRTEESLKLEAIKGALADSGLSFADIDGIIPMEASMHGPGLVYHMQWAEQLGGRPLGFMGIGQDLEEMGFCKLGEGPAYFAEGHTRLGGSMPSNTDGGLLSNSHNTNPSGMHTVEVVRQLRGECGARQVPEARIGISLAQGYAVHGMAGTLIMAV